jgi:hypothetical protein
MRDYWTCSNCGANLDPGESCDCREEDADEIQDSKSPVQVEGYRKVS